MFLTLNVESLPLEREFCFKNQIRNCKNLFDRQRKITSGKMDFAIFFERKKKVFIKKNLKEKNPTVRTN